MNEHDQSEIMLPEGATILEEREPFEPSVEVALELARLGVSDIAIEALGGEDAVALVRGEREDGERAVEDVQGPGPARGHKRNAERDGE